MVLVAPRASFIDCYVQRVFTQMGLLKAIKYSTFEVFIQMKIVDDYEPEMKISGADLLYST